MHRRYRNVEIEQLAARLDDEAELKLTSKKLTGQDIEILAKPLRKNRTLTTLYLSENQIGALGAQHLANALQHNTVILILYSSISFNHLHFLSQTLTALDLSSNGIGALEAQHLADALQHNTTLTTLDLYDNQIGDKGAQHLADALQHNTTLTTLDLSSNDIGDELMDCVAKLIERNEMEK
ncbi:unnamed protein product [Rotaria magnacalcarata]